MGIAGKIRGPGRRALVQEHRRNVFEEVFSLYIDGRASVADVQVRAQKLKLLRRQRPRRYLPFKRDNIGE
ncbi:hypothetical protein ES703_15122 [subsurface metagenome]